MQTLALKIKNIKTLNEIQLALSKHQTLTEDQQNVLSDLLKNLPSTDWLLSEKISFFEPFEVKLWDMDQIEDLFEKWKDLFCNIPGYDFAPSCYILINQEVIGDDELQLLGKNVLMVATFAPSATYGLTHGDGYKVHLKDDGTASFLLPTLEDAEKYPELYHFNGSWKEAYLLLIATLQKGWPMEEFPEGLQKFLPKQ